MRDHSSSIETNNSPGHFRWIVCALLFFATTINYMDRQLLSLLKPILDQHPNPVDFPL